MRRIGWLLVCVMVLQGFAFAALSSAHRARGAAGVLAIDQCSQGAPDDHDAPSTRRGHAQCCILCSFNEHKGLPDVADIWSKTGVSQTSCSIAFVFSRSSGARDARPAGWTSSWSSQSPPLFS